MLNTTLTLQLGIVSINPASPQSRDFIIPLGPGAGGDENLQINVGDIFLAKLPAFCASRLSSGSNRGPFFLAS